MFEALHYKILHLFFQGGKINSLDFHRTADVLVTASDDDSVRFYDITTAQ